MAEAQPITTPATVSAGLPGSPAWALGRRSSASWRAMRMEGTDDLLQQRAVDGGGGQGAQGAAEDDAQGHPGEQPPAHGAESVVGPDGIERGEDDGGQRGTHRQVGEDVRIEALGGKAVDQHRHDDQAATDPEQTGQQPGADAEHQEEQEIHHHLGRRRRHGTPLPARREAAFPPGTLSSGRWPPG